MNILGIETSCDETSAAIVRGGRTILSNVVVSSLKKHKKYGGVIPEIASRKQLECIHSIVEASLNEANIKLSSIKAIAATSSPGLIGSLLVGLSFARALSFAVKKPLILVDHIKAHLYANFLVSKDKSRQSQHCPKFPAVGLVVSGGHTSLYHIRSFKKYALLGQTRDDAVGEAFDKVARILDLGYPGGPPIDRLSKKVKKSNIKFTCAQLPGTLDFSFSGIKTAVLYHKNKHTDASPYPLNETAFAFQQSVVNTLVKKSLLACKKLKSNHLVVGGGVAANSQLRTQLQKEAEELNIQTHFPPIALCMDNAAMIAGLGYHYL